MCIKCVSWLRLTRASLALVMMPRSMAGIPGFTSHGIYTYSSGSVVVNGGNIANKATDQGSTGGSVINGAVTVNAGMFTGRIENYYGIPVIKGSIFNFDPSKWVVDGYEATKDEAKDTWTVQKKEVPDVPEDPDDLPEATVKNSDEYENVDLPWGSYGAWSPTEGLDAKLEAAYTFSCKDTLEEAKANLFANWYCDFYVKLDRALGENQIFLGGNYGSFGWVGFHNGPLTLGANEEIALLGSVTSNPWTYLDVVQNVGTFICGVGDVDDALKGATFTVMLRLTNPADETEFYNVATINYTFE